MTLIGPVLSFLNTIKAPINKIRLSILRALNETAPSGQKQAMIIDTPLAAIRAVTAGRRPFKIALTLLNCRYL